MNIILSHAIFVCSIFATGVIGDIIQKPLNAATSIRTQEVFECSSSLNSSAITWLSSTDCNTTNGVPLTVTNCELNSSYAANYKTEKPDEFTCNLVVYRAELSHGGCYICTDGNGQEASASALLIIVGTSAASMIPSSIAIIPGDDVMITNTVSYSGPSVLYLPPSFYWTLMSDTSQNITSQPGFTNNTSASSYIVVTAYKPVVPPYLCHLFFNPPTNVPTECATNAPSYRITWATPTYNVSYGAQNVAISGVPNPCIYQPLQVILTCSASGYPTPTYAWLNVTNNDVLSESSTLVIDRGGIYKCYASNVIRYLRFTSERTVNVSDCESDSTPIGCPSNCSNTDETAIIVLSVFLAIAILVAIGLATWIVFGLLPKMRSQQGSTSNRDEDSSRQSAYESVVKPTTTSDY